MKKYQNSFAQSAYDILSPIIGDMMARGTMKSKASILGVTEETLRKDHMPRLAEEIRKGLVIFLGKDAADKVSSKISKIV